MNDLRRRDFLKGSAFLASTAATGGFGGFVCVGPASAGPIEAPVVDRLAIRVLVDSGYDNAFTAKQVNGVAIQPGPRNGVPDFRRIWHNQWGLSLYVESQRAGEARTLMLDYGYTPDALINNMEITGADPRKINTLILSHGHQDHFGGLIGFLDKYRDVLPDDLTLYCGGEDNFCHRYNRTGTAGELASYGVLDRREIAARRVKIVLCETPTVVEHAFTTGMIQRTSIERVLPNSMVELGVKDGLGCNASHFTPAELQGKIVPDEHPHEHATCFNVKDRGLVVISSCGHVGIVNSARQAQAVSGVQKVHTLMGGFHLGPAPKDYLDQVIGEIKALNPDVVIPLHCSGNNFIQAMREQMPDKLLVATTGSRITFGG
jgi:7,8-dihydropterin-6-yl-methyl-4-(beta-D-ribofuranosyl)aminobenzene 5'-phosphate synthase